MCLNFKTIITLYERLPLNCDNCIGIIRYQFVIAEHFNIILGHSTMNDD